MGKCVLLGVIINDIICCKYLIILNIRVRWDLCGSVRRNLIESLYLFIVDFSDLDDEIFVINIDKRLFIFEVIIKLCFLEIFSKI